MNNIKFRCVNLKCGKTLEALPQQVGLKIICPKCDQTLIVPELWQNSTSSTERESFRTLKEENRPLSFPISSNRETDKVKNIKIDFRSRSSFIDKLYAEIGKLVDKIIGEEIPESGIKKLLFIPRINYNKLSSVRKQHVTFFISLGLVFAIVFGLSFKLPMAIMFASIWAAFVALNQVSVLDKAFRGLTNILVYTTIFFLPEALKSILSGSLKYIFNILIVFWLGVFIGPIYILYKGVLIAFDKAEL